MSTLVVVGYGDPFRAEEVHLQLRRMQREYLIDLDDAAFAVKDERGRVKLHQSVNLTAAGAIRGGFWGTLIGLIFLNPLLGMAAGMLAIPVQVFIQTRPPEDQKGRMIAVMNLTNFVAILLSGAIYMGFDRLVGVAGWPRSVFFALTALLILPVAVLYRPEQAGGRRSEVRGRT